MKEFKHYITEAARSRGEQMEHSIVTAINGKEEAMPDITMGAGKKVADALKLSGSASVLGADQIEVTSEWSKYWPGGKVPSSTKTPKTDIKVVKQKISLKTGSAAQLMSGGKNESVATFYAALAKGSDSKDPILKKIESAINDLAASSVAAGKLAKEIKKGEDPAVMRANAAHKILQDDIRNLFTGNKEFAYNFCFEAMAGQVKFGGNDGTCSHFLTCDFEGNDAHLIPVTNKGYVTKIASRVKPTVRFKSTSEKSKGKKTGRYRYWSVVGLIVDKLNEEIAQAGDMLTEGIVDKIIKKVKQFALKIWNGVKNWLFESWNNIFEFLSMTPMIQLASNNISFAP